MGSKFGRGAGAAAANWSFSDLPHRRRKYIMGHVEKNVL